MEEWETRVLLATLVGLHYFVIACLMLGILFKLFNGS
jgi:hypothetical protein